eukprot:gene7967-10041_t
MEMIEKFRGQVIIDCPDCPALNKAEEFGAIALVPGDTSSGGGYGRCEEVSSDMKRIPDKSLIEYAKSNNTIPIIGRISKGHFAEAQTMEELGCEWIDENENFMKLGGIEIDTTKFKAKFMCGVSTFIEAVSAISKGYALLRIIGGGEKTSFAMTVRSICSIMKTVKSLKHINSDNEVDESAVSDEVRRLANVAEVPLDLVWKIAKDQRFPVPIYADGGIATAADVSLVMQLGCDGVFLRQQEVAQIFRAMRSKEIFDEFKFAVQVATNTEAMVSYNSTSIHGPAISGISTQPPKEEEDAKSKEEPEKKEGMADWW